MDLDKFDGFAMHLAEAHAGPVPRRRLLTRIATAGLSALGLGIVLSEGADARSCRRRCRNKSSARKRRRCLRRCRQQDPGPEVGCSPPNNTQGSCPRGQICNNRSICVAGCTGTGQGSCPSGQSCINGQCV